MKKFCLGLGLVFLFAAPAFGAGMAAHTMMSEIALGEVRDPELTALLAANRDAVLRGTTYPDTGYALRYTPQYHGQWDYGEDTHLPTFIEAYLAYLREHCPAENSACAPLIAHFLGVAAHDLEDQLYDEILIPRARKIDFPAEAHPRYDHDIGVDMLIIVDQKRWRDIPRLYVPVEELVQVYHRVGLSVTPYQIRLGNSLLKLAEEAERAIAPGEYRKYHDGAPWFAAHYMTEPGGILYNGRMVARYWPTLWARLKGQAVEPLLATEPAAGATGVAPDAMIHAIFSRGIEDPSLGPATFLVRDPEGRPISGAIRSGRSPIGTSAWVATFTPAEPLRPGTTYTVTLTTGITDLDRVPLPHDYSWELTTAPVGN